MLTTIILITSGISLIALIAVVLYSNPKASVNRWLSVFMFAGLLWLIANLFANVFMGDSAKYLFFSRLALAGPALLPTSFLLFSLAYANRHVAPLLRVMLFMPTALLLALVPTSYNIKAISTDGVSLITGVAYPILIMTLLVYFSIGSVLLAKQYSHANQKVRQQLQYILLGFIFSVVPGIILSAILPALGNSNSVAYAPVFVIVFSLFTSIAIIRHKLFDIRFYVVRALAYSLTVVALGAVYVAPGVYIITRLIGAKLELNELLITIIAATVLATNYSKVRSWFDRLSNKLFFRDAYDPQDVLVRANRAAVVSIDIDMLVSRTSTIILDSIKPQYVVFDLSPTAYVGRRLLGDVHHIPDESKIEELEKIMTQLGMDTILADEVIEDSPELHELMSDMRISFIQRIVLRSDAQESKYGLLILGTKKSGVAYDSQDKETIRVVMGEFSIALQNALQYEEIQKFNVTLQEKIDDATKKLRTSNDKLRKLDEAKDEFISMASHQLRTPLTSIKGYLSMVLEGDAGNVTDTQKQMLNQAYVSSQRMVYLISDLLNLSRINTGKFVIDPSPVDLRDIVDAEINQLRETAKARDITINYEAPENYPTLMLDETKIHQVVMNFMDNAIYYTSPGGTVTIELDETETAVEFSVKDSGIGVPRADQKHLFGKFYRAGNARKIRPDGTGLGLFMSKKVVATQNGAIIFDSEEGKGSTFGFRFSKASHALEHKEEDK